MHSLLILNGILLLINVGKCTLKGTQIYIFMSTKPLSIHLEIAEALIVLVGK